MSHSSRGPQGSMRRWNKSRTMYKMFTMLYYESTIQQYHPSKHISTVKHSEESPFMWVCFSASKLVVTKPPLTSGGFFHAVQQCIARGILHFHVKVYIQATYCSAFLEIMHVLLLAPLALKELKIMHVLYILYGCFFFL